MVTVLCFLQTVLSIVYAIYIFYLIVVLFHVAILSHNTSLTVFSSNKVEWVCWLSDKLWCNLGIPIDLPSVRWTATKLLPVCGSKRAILAAVGSVVHSFPFHLFPPLKLYCLKSFFSLLTVLIVYGTTLLATTVALFISLGHWFLSVADFRLMTVFLLMTCLDVLMETWCCWKYLLVVF